MDHNASVFPLKILKNILAFSMIFLMAFSSMAQEDEDFIHVFGTLKDYNTKKKLSGVTIVVTQNGKKFKEQVTTANGKFEFFLPLDHQYNVKCNKTKFVSKNIDIDSRNVPEDVRRGGFSMNIDLDLFESIPDIDFSFLNNPMGKANWDATTGSINWNYEYINSMKSEIDRLMREYDKKKKESDKEEDTVAKEEVERNLKFENLMKEGGVLLANRKYRDAVKKYEAAIAIKGDNPTAKKKLEEAKNKLKEEEELAEASKKYNELVDKGDDSFRARNYQDAIGHYEAALVIKKEEKYPKDQIAQAKLKLEELEAAAAKDKEFDDLVAKGDIQLEKNEFDGAINDYKKAMTIKPLDKEIKTKISNAQKMQKDFLANAAKEEEYQAAIKEADKNFSDEKYNEAISRYNAALRIKPKDEYATGQIEKADQAQKDMMAAQNAAKELVAKQDQFDKFMAEGIKNMESEGYRLAVNNFEDALDLFNDDPTAISKLDEAKAKLAEQESNMAKQDQYDAIIRTADKQFGGKDYENSLSSYKEAKGIMDTEYVNKKIAVTEKIIADLIDKAEKERLAALENEKNAKEKAERDKKFKEFVDNGDASFSKREFQEAIDSYTSALDIYSDDIKVKAKLEKAEKGLSEANALLAANEEAKKVEEARLAELEKMKAEEAARKKEEEEAAKKRSEEMNNLTAQYENFIAIADEQFADKNYDLAIENYESALVLKEEEKYPVAQIEKIRRVKKKIEEDKAAEEALAEERRRKEDELARQRELTKGKFSSDLEKDAEEYMAKLREERRKERVVKSAQEKTNWQERIKTFEDVNKGNIELNKDQVEKYKENIAERNLRFEEERKVRAGDMETVKDNVKSFLGDGTERQRKHIDEAVDKTEEIKESKEELSQRTYSTIAENVEEITEKREKQFAIIQAGKDLQANGFKDVDVARKIYDSNNARYSSEGFKSVKDANYEIETFKKNSNKLNKEKVIESREGKSEHMERQKSKVNSFYTTKASEQRDRLQNSKENVDNIERHSSKPSPNDLIRNPLADQYPQGITEDKVVENGRVILTRYVVVGNKVDIYKKIIGLNQNFYFHNGVSCTEATWERESTVILE